jgi:glutaredoxin
MIVGGSYNVAPTLIKPNQANKTKVPYKTNITNKTTMKGHDIIQSIVRAAGPDGVVLFSKSFCPYCRRAKEALIKTGIVPVVVELDERKDGREIQVALMQLTGQRTVPSAWVRGKHIGGSDDVVAGVSSGLFDDIPRQEARQYAELSGLKPCTAGDGIPCLCFA